MSYIALYRKWRPLVFENVVEQSHVVQTLRNSVVAGRIAHAYLFCGTRGTGKTTMAKIFSRAINCTNPKNGDPCNECEVCKGILTENILDVIEIDAASNNGVDNIREIRDEVAYSPTTAKYKVYIIDEVHMLSTGAFNALLKTLEEPPQHVVFILATTDPQKLPATILSRCQRFDFRRITVESIAEHISSIAVESGVSIQKEAARLIAKISDGAMRDGISILDQCISQGRKEISYEMVLEVVGIVNETFIAEVIDCISNKDIRKVLGLIERLIMDGKDIAQFVTDLIFCFRNLLICKIDNNPGQIIEASTEALDWLKEQCSHFEREEIVFIIKDFSSLGAAIKWAAHPRVLVEVALIKICEGRFNSSESSLQERITNLESKLNNSEYVSKLSSQENKQEYLIKPSSLVINSQSTQNNVSSEKGLKEPFINRLKEVNSHKNANTKSLELWAEIIEELKKNGRMAIYTNLLGTRAIELNSKFIGIVFASGSSFNKMLISKVENLEVLEAAISKKLGKEMRVKCIDEDDSDTEDSRANEEDAFVDKARSIADKLNMTINIIDE